MIKNHMVQYDGMVCISLFICKVIRSKTSSRFFLFSHKGSFWSFQNIDGRYNAEIHLRKYDIGDKKQTICKYIFLTISSRNAQAQFGVSFH